MVSIIIPVIRRKNLDHLKELIKQNAGTDDYEIVWKEDEDRIGCPKMVKNLVERSKGDKVCFLGDDTEPQKDFLKNALQAMESSGKYLIGMRDNRSDHMAHWLADKRLLPIIGGEFFHTEYLHNFCDDELRHRAQRAEQFQWCYESIVLHNHPVYGTADLDEDYIRVLNKERFAIDNKLFQQRNCTMSAVIIVKNEEKMLAECLESVKDADEIIVVDTGSIDKTKEVAAKYTDKIYDFPWIDDFAAARNFAKSKATMDWCISIDADEVLESNGIALLKSGLSTDSNVVKVHMWSPNDDFHVPRVFRNRPSIQWVGRVHEVLNESMGPQSNVKINYRFGDSHALDPDRNIRLLEKAYADDPKNTRGMFYLAREYEYRGQHQESKELFLKYLDVSTWMPERADAYYWLAGIYWKTGEPDKAREACMNALTINSNFKAACLFMATMSWEHNAVQWRRMAETATNEGVLFTHLGRS